MATYISCNLLSFLHVFMYNCDSNVINRQSINYIKKPICRVKLYRIVLYDGLICILFAVF